MIVQGYFRIFSFFDIAEAIDVKSLRAILGPAAAPRSPAFTHLTPEYAQAQHVPIVESMGPLALPTGEKLDARIKYYWFGVVGVELTSGFECDFDSLCPQSYRWMNAPEVEKAAEALLRTHLDRIRPALIRPSPKWLDEDYLVIDIESAHADGRPLRDAPSKCSNLMPIRSRNSSAASSFRCRLPSVMRSCAPRCLTIPAT